MTRYDFSALENVEYQACVDFYRAAPEEVRRVHAIDVFSIAAATCFTGRDLNPPSVFRRAVGLGVSRETSEAELDDVIARMSARTPQFAVTVAPQSRPSKVAAWLETRGFTRAWAWMKFCRPCGGLQAPQSTLDIRVVDSSLAGEFGRIVTQGFGMPSTTAPWMGALAGRTDWICVMAFLAETPIAAGAAYVSGDYAWIAFGATLEAHRRHGAQNALLARRLGEAAARGARVAVTETGERVPDRPSNSYRNILRAGFEEQYVRQNYLSPMK